MTATSKRSPGPARGVVHRDAPDGVLEHRRVPPPDVLEAFVAHFWTVEYALGSPFCARTLPHPTTHVVFEMGPGGRAAQVAFPHTSRFERRLEGTGFVFGVKLRPAMAGAFYPAHAARLRGRVLRLEATRDFSTVVGCSPRAYARRNAGAR